MQKEENLAPACLGAFVHLARATSWGRHDLRLWHAGAERFGYVKGSICAATVRYDDFVEPQCRHVREGLCEDLLFVERRNDDGDRHRDSMADKVSGFVLTSFKGSTYYKKILGDQDY
jgi:hypothetical protein